MVSFMELIEFVVVTRFRRGTPASRPITLQRLRDARTYAQNSFGLPYRFASLKLKQIGGHGRLRKHALAL